ncbi:hypothetical protein [Arthrospiribacter ruber]|uniref:Uncharacterized protein n=1 Tax=Arthrospiribacter ruber TaxID=2487934 RepID=A0A951IV26_9BACT|nr:hypothetical protein [Arthrospiribacter ruber]MBW3466577.1 hypothetical protein [Arthrospiribacter ruber]
MKNLLFVSWDSDQSNYLETLFFPILHGLQKKGLIQAHVIQFSWAPKAKVSHIRKAAEDLGINFTHHKVSKKPFAGLGALQAVYKGVFLLKRYIENHGVEIVMPRSTMPATMVNRLWDWLRKNRVKVIFDADGFPIQERVDFAGMNKDSLYHRLLSQEEQKMLLHADRILVRSKKAKEKHGQAIGESILPKIVSVANGRDAKHFFIDKEKRQAARESLGLEEEHVLWVYTGSLGPQYRLEEMLALFKMYWNKDRQARFLILTPQQHVDLSFLPSEIKNCISIQAVEYDEIPAFLNAADLGLSLRKEAPSIAGLSPIKTGEYLIMGLPVVLSPGVGDTDEILRGKDFAYFWEKGGEEGLMLWLQNLKSHNSAEIREFAMNYFSLEKSVEDYSVALEGL